MANEARVFAEGVDNFVKVRTYTVADGTAIAKGALLCDGGDRTAIIHLGGFGRAPLGFATSSKVASDGNTTIGVQRTGVVDAFVDGSANSGELAILGTTVNRVSHVVSGQLSAYEHAQAVVGRFLEDATDGEQKKIALTLG